MAKNNDTTSMTNAQLKAEISQETFEVEAERFNALPSLHKKQQDFVTYYLADPHKNIAESARKAGYASVSSGYKLMEHAGVRAWIDYFIDADHARGTFKLTDGVLLDIALGKPREVKVTVTDDDGVEIAETKYMYPSFADQTKAIAELNKVGGRYVTKIDISRTDKKILEISEYVEAIDAGEATIDLDALTNDVLQLTE